MDDTCHPKLSIQVPYKVHTPMGIPAMDCFHRPSLKADEKKAMAVLDVNLALDWKLIGSRSSFHVSSSFYIMFISYISGIGRDGIPSRFKKTSGSESKCRNRPFQRLRQKCVLCQTLTKIECRPV